MTKLTDGYDVKRVREAAEIIIEAFHWEDTEEGGEFWEDVYEALDRIADESDILYKDIGRMTKAQLVELVGQLRERIEADG